MPPTNKLIELNTLPWEKQAAETFPQWTAFLHYRDFGTSRSVAITAEAVGAPLSTLKRYSKTGRWNWRITEWENYLDEVRRNAHVETVEDMAHRHSSLARLGIRKAEEALRLLKTEEMTANEAARLLDVSVKIERLSMGANTQNVAQRVQALMMEVITDAVGVLPEEHRAKFIDKFQRSLAAKAAASVGEEEP